MSSTSECKVLIQLLIDQQNEKAKRKRQRSNEKYAHDLKLLDDRLAELESRLQLLISSHSTSTNSVPQHHTSS
jgi:hypothetical protein